MAATPPASHRMVPKRRLAKTPPTHIAALQPVDEVTAVTLELSQRDAEHGAAPTDCDPLVLRDGDEIWRIDSTDAPCPAGDQPTADGLGYYQLDGRRSWQPATLQGFAEAGRDHIATVFVFHGNRTSLDEATGMVWDVYRHVSQSDQRPLRMVVWTWPSGRTFTRPRHDARLKVERSEWTGQQLAGVLEQLDPHAPVGLVGFSFGARAVIEALQIRGQGASQAADPHLNVSLQQDRPAPIRALLIAAAIDNDALLRGGAYELAVAQVDRMIVTSNGCDWLLRAYRHLYCWHGPDSLGLTGPVADGSSGGGGFANVESLDVSASVGRIHRWPNYIQAPEIIAALRDDLLGQREL